jgi:hypothetical protein
VKYFQVLSPITGRVIGAKEVRVVSDKVSITRLQVRVVSGLQLSIVPDNAVENGYIAETSVTRKLTAQYQVWKVLYPLFQETCSVNHKRKDYFLFLCLSSVFFYLASFCTHY